MNKSTSFNVLCLPRVKSVRHWSTSLVSWWWHCPIKYIYTVFGSTLLDRWLCLLVCGALVNMGGLSINPSDKWCVLVIFHWFNLSSIASLCWLPCILPSLACLSRSVPWFILLVDAWDYLVFKKMNTWIFAIRDRSCYGVRIAFTLSPLVINFFYPTVDHCTIILFIFILDFLEVFVWLNIKHQSDDYWPTTCTSPPHSSPSLYLHLRVSKLYHHSTSSFLRQLAEYSCFHAFVFHSL